jgi:hypothetical protein
MVVPPCIDQDAELRFSIIVFLREFLFFVYIFDNDFLLKFDLGLPGNSLFDPIPTASHWIETN